MKCLSIRQPWAGAILAGLKTIETRTWMTTYRGPLLIHAGKKPDESVQAQLLWAEDEPFMRTFGAVIGCAMLVDCRPMTKSDEWDARCEWYPRAVAWVLADPLVFETPIPWKGALGLFDVVLAPAAPIPSPVEQPGARPEGVAAPSGHSFPNPPEVTR